MGPAGRANKHDRDYPLKKTLPPKFAPNYTKSLSGVLAKKPTTASKHSLEDLCLDRSSVCTV